MNSASPDELALVEKTKELGYAFLGRDSHNVIRINRLVDNKTLEFQLLNTLEFNSTRKRMSVIVRDL